MANKYVHMLCIMNKFNLDAKQIYNWKAKMQM